MDGLQLAALYSLQHCLAGYAKTFGDLLHGKVVFRSLLNKERLELIGDADAPRRARGDLFAGDEAVIEPAVERRGRDVEDFCGLPDGDWLPLRRLSRWLEAGDLPVPAQVADMAGGETVAATRTDTPGDSHLSGPSHRGEP